MPNSTQLRNSNVHLTSSTPANTNNNNSGYLCIDSLHFTVYDLDYIDLILNTDGSITDLNNFRLEPSKETHKEYNEIYDVYHFEHKFCTLLLGNKRTSLYGGIEINKHYLYLFGDKVENIINEFLTIYRLEYNNINYLELAYNTLQDITNAFGEHYTNSTRNKHCKDKIYTYKSKSKVNTFNDFSSYTVGNKRKSSKEIAIYNKTKEVNEKGGDYALQVINKALNNTNNLPVHRIEVRLLKRVIEKQGINNLNNIFNPQFREKIYKYNMGNNLLFNDLQTKYIDKNRHVKYKEINLLPLNHFSDYVPEPKEIKASNKQLQMGYNRELKSAIDHYLSTNNIVYFRALKTRIFNNNNNYSIEDFTQKINNWINNFKGEKKYNEAINKLRELANTGIYELFSSMTIEQEPTKEERIKEEINTPVETPKKVITIEEVKELQREFNITSEMYFNYGNDINNNFTYKPKMKKYYNMINENLNSIISGNIIINNAYKANLNDYIELMINEVSNHKKEKQKPIKEVKEPYKIPSQEEFNLKFPQPIWEPPSKQVLNMLSNN